jgi:hypothetical protein
MRPDGGHVGNLVPLQSHGATSHIVEPIIVKKVLMDSWKRRGHKEILPILTSKSYLFTFLRESNTEVRMAMCDCLSVRRDGSSPEETSVTGTLTTDLNTGDETAPVAGRHDKTCLVLPVARRLISNYTSLRRAAEQEKESSLDTNWCEISNSV